MGARSGLAPGRVPISVLSMRPTFTRASQWSAEDDRLFDSLFDESEDLTPPEPPASPEALLSVASASESLPLTSEQETFALKVLSMMGKVNNDPNVLEGPAGTGKTTTLIRLIKAAVSGWGKNAVHVAAFTHKACSVLGGVLATWEDRPQVTTLHSLLHLQPKKVQYGQPETFTQKRFPNLGGMYLLLIDECSMIGADLFKHIEEARLAHPYLTVVYAGDPNQLQPVGEKALSRTFKAGPKYELTRVLRHDGAILSQATRIRQLRHVPQLIPCEGGGTEVVLHKTARELETTWMDMVLEVEHLGDASNCIMLCYTNDNRRKFNDRARKAIHGPEVPMFMPGDVLVTLSAYEQLGSIVLNNNQDVIVREARQKSFTFANHGEDGHYEGWELALRNDLTIPVLNPDDAKRFKRAVRSLGKEIKAQVDQAQADRNLRLVQQYKRRWTTEYFPDSAYFAEVDFRYALTIHKSQGSTYKNVFITDDYMKSRDEARNLLYVALTRAAVSVHHVDNRIRR